MQRRGGEYSTATIVLHVWSVALASLSLVRVAVLVIVLHSTTKLIVLNSCSSVSIL